MPNTKFIYGLNSLRFFAFLAIYIFHATPFLPYGYYGVDFFFVLSSFLLTHLAINEIKATGGFSKVNFFIRRALRIFPLYYLVVFISFFIIPNFFSITLPEKPIYYYLLLANFEVTDSIFALKFLWSISVEEQFYLLFILLSPLFRKKIPVVIFLLASIFVLAIIINTYHPKTIDPWNPIAHFNDFAMGITVAYLYSKGVYSLKFTIITLILAIVSLFTLGQDSFIGSIFIPLTFGLVVLMAINHQETIKRFKATQLTEYLGKYTYGLYVYSGFIITGVAKFGSNYNPIIIFIISSLVLWLMAYVSFEYFEKPILKFKRHFVSKPSKV